MVRPVCVNYTKFCNRRITVLCISEVITAELEVCKCHCKAHGIVILLHLIVIPAVEALYPLNIFGNGNFHIKSLWLFKRCKTAFNRVDKVLLNLYKLFVCNIALESNYSCCEDLATLTLSKKLNALLGRVAALIVLTGEILHCEYLPAVLNGESFFIDYIGVRL